MNFETMDWEAEAERVRHAFCANDLIPFHKSASGCTIEIQTPQGGLSMQYGEDGRYFALQGQEQIPTEISINWDGTLDGQAVCGPETQADSDFIAKGLFHLDSLTPEVEAALQVSISNHQKLEWQLEYEARLKAAKP